MKARAVGRRDEVGSDPLRRGVFADSALGFNSSTDASIADRIVEHSLRALFLLVAVLLFADLHSSYVAARGQWEMNPVLAALAEHIGARAALVSAKVADLAMLAGLYALWRRSKANVAITLVLVIAAFEYAQIVVNNYQS